MKPCSPCKTELTDRERQVLELARTRIKRCGQLEHKERVKIADIAGLTPEYVRQLVKELRKAGHLPFAPGGAMESENDPWNLDRWEPSQEEKDAIAQDIAAIRAQRDPRPYRPEPAADTGRWVRAWKRGKAAQEYLHSIRRRYPTRLHEHDEPRTFRVVGSKEVRRIVETRELAARRPWTWGIGGRAS
jgi:DNA-binding CsgD family transcriptional regulator